jgi:hypothetical protein
MGLSAILVTQVKKTHWEYDRWNVVMICEENKVKNQ